MTVNQNELLSALVDGELQGKELEQAMHLLNTSEQARVLFQRYQLASDVLHGHVSSLTSTVDLTSRISMALLDEAEPENNAMPKSKARVIPFPKHFWKQATGLAIAASVGALAVIGVMTQPQNQLVPTSPLVATNAVSTPVNQPVKVARASNRWTVDEQEVESRLNTYLVDHNEYAGASDVFSYARVVAYDAGQ